MTAHPALLSAEQVSSFHRDGYLILKSFYDLSSEIEPIQRGIHQIIRLVIQKHGLDISQSPFSPETFDTGFQPLIAFNRSLGGEVYDAVKQIPAFMRLVASPRNEAIVRQLRGTELPGIAAGGFGIRIDNPEEERFRAGWHQDYPAQLRSYDGLVFWSSLVPISQELGPVEICVGSHLEGPLPVLTHDPKHPDKAGAYGLTFLDEDKVVNRFPRVAPLSQPGDLLMFDYQLVHRSGQNRGQRARWSMQLRYFNFFDPAGIRLGWRGSFADGVKLQDVHPELVKA